ncbi:MAG: hypothetical protein ABFR82_17790 [Nitrospirota bacterium]
MKKLMSIMVIIILTVSFLVVGTKDADARNNESAALLTAGLVLLSIPVMHAIAHSGPYGEPAYSYADPPRYIERTKIIYVQPKYKKHRRHWRKSYRRGYRKEWKRLQYRRGMRDARRDYRWERDYDYR